MLNTSLLLETSLFELLVRGIPEAFLFVLAGHVFSKTRINKKRYLLSSVLFAALVYGIRSLPIQYGVHTILSLILLIVIMVFINQVDIIKAIRAGIIAIIIAFISEGTNVFTLLYVLKKDMNSIFSNPTLKTLYGIPSSIIFACIILICYFLFSKRKELKKS